MNGEVPTFGTLSDPVLEKDLEKDISGMEKSSQRYARGYCLSLIRKPLG